jgi:WD40 repeat protein
MSWKCILAGLLCGWPLGIVLGQQPTPPPALPAVNPAVARLEQTAGELDGPGVAIAYCDERRLLVAAGEHATLSCWRQDITLGVRASLSAGEQFHGHQSPITALVAGAGLVASGGADGKILLWDLPEGKILHTLTAAPFVRGLALAPDGKLLASVGDDAVVQLWDTATGKPGLKLAGAKDWLRAVAFSPDGKSVAAAGHDGRLRLWETATGKPLLDVSVTPPPPANTPATAAPVISALAFSPDSKTLAAGGSDAQVSLFQTADGKLVRSLAGHTSAISAVAFHPGGAFLVSASKDRTLRLWNPANGQLIKALEGHTSWVQGVAFLHQGTRLASVSADQTVRLWDLTDPAKK